MTAQGRSRTPPKGDDAPAPASTPFDAVRAAMEQAQQTWIAPWQSAAGRALEAPSSLLEEWRRTFLSFAGQNAVFKTRIQKGGRLSIPEGERDALGLGEGDLVQVIIIPIQKRK